MGSEDKIFTTPRIIRSGGGSFNQSDYLLMSLVDFLVVGFIARHSRIMYNTF